MADVVNIKDKAAQDKAAQDEAARLLKFEEDVRQFVLRQFERLENMGGTRAQYQGLFDAAVKDISRTTDVLLKHGVPPALTNRLTLNSMLLTVLARVAIRDGEAPYGTPELKPKLVEALNVAMSEIWATRTREPAK